MNNDSEITVVALLDAFRHDYIDTDNAPFLSSLADNDASGANEEPFGYQTRPAFFAGLYPETSGICTMFERTEQSSPFRVARFIPSILDDRKYIDWGLRRLLEAYIRRRSPNSGVQAYGTPASVPFALLDEFDFAEKELPWDPEYLKQPTIFDVLRANDRQWWYGGWPLVTGHDSDDLVVNTCIENLSQQHSFLYIHLSELDGLGHAHGPHSTPVKEGIRRCDDRLRQIWEHCEDQFDVVNLIAFGDHGMVEVVRTVDVWSQLQTISLKIGEDYHMFLDSTMARFWFESERAERQIRSLLGKLDAGKILSEADKKEYRIRFSDDRSGELIYLMDPGTMIAPNFFHRGSQDISGMHGYAPDCPEDQGLLLVHSTETPTPESIETRPMVDIFPTALDFMGLPIPDSSEGQSILQDSI